MRTILLASAIASLNRLSRRAAASIQDFRHASLSSVGAGGRHGLPGRTVSPFLICGMELRIRRRSELVKLWNEAPTPVLVLPG